MADYDKEQWQAEERARDEAQTAFRDKMAKSRQRSANNAKRKIARLHAKLKELGHISEFEDEFGESVLERLDKFGSAFHDPEKGRAGDALSLAQRQVVNRMNKKVKELKAKKMTADNCDDRSDGADDFKEDYIRTGWGAKKASSEPSGGRSSFDQKGGFKRKSKFTPRVRQLEDDLEDPREAPVMGESSASSLPVFDETVRPFLPQYRPEKEGEALPKREGPKIKAPRTENSAQSVTSSKKPFLRLVPSEVSSHH